jgi:PhoH-like ATPase|tara:strand:- start:454 stop:1095 length:642 start_codon:yes stop_codon:yes gene_type:complete
MGIKSWGIRSKNPEQEEALKVLMDPSVELVVLNGGAGSGKTLLSLASALELVIEQHMYKEIVFTRGPTGVGEDLGHLPGELEEKLLPWMGALMDNLEMLVGDSKTTQSIIESKIKTISIQHIRGRSLRGRFVIIDEVQNLTPQQLKVIITRIGENSKIVCLGDTSQIDNRKLTIHNNALTILESRIGNEDFIKAIYLKDCERSRLSRWGGENL